jgi:DNA mismatch repair protein MLH1
MKRSLNLFYSSTVCFNSKLTHVERLVENKNLKKALSSVFENYIPKGTHPFIFVSMMMNPKKIDVNVHPTKEEVIFLREEEIIAELKEKVREKLLSSDNSRVFVAQTTTALKSKVALASGQSLPPTLTKPQSLDRTDVVDKQQGAMELYLDSSKKRPNTTEPVVPRKKQKLDTHELTSVQNILNDFEEQEHEALKKMFKDATFVGCASAEISLVQYETKLYALNMRNVSSAFMFQVRSLLLTNK